MATFKQYTASGGASENFSIPTFSSDEIKDRNRDIEMLKLRASQFKEKWEESEQKIKEELESIKLQRELKAYNKKRVAEGFKALRYPEYQRLKREGKIK